MAKENITLYEALKRTIGKRLLSVKFVHDYVQLEWDTSFITAFSMPLLWTAGLKYMPGNPEYCKVICDLKGQILTGAEVIPAESVNLSFSNDALLTISLRDKDYVGPEAMQYGEADGSLWVV